MKKFKGIPASPGIAIGKAYLFKREKVEIVKKEIPPELVNKEVKRFHESLMKAKNYLNELIKKVRSEVGEKEAEIYEAQLMMLEDESSFIKPVEKMISEGVCAEYAVEKVLEQMISLLSSMDSEYMRERAMDVKDVKELVISFLTGKGRRREHLSEESIVVAEELLPSDIASLNKSKIMAFVTDKGGPTSHVAIVARTMKVPAVVGAEGFSSQIKGGELLVVDGREGSIVINPTEEVLSEYRRRKMEGEVLFVELLKEASLPAVTIDGFKFKVYANVGNLKDVKDAIRYGAEGIGLLRTEFMYTDREALPSEEELLETFLEIAQIMGDRPVIVRTLDIGCDKPLPYLRMPEEENPFLGCRGIRFTLKNPDILRVQFKAILRAASKGNFRIMFPMITRVEEVVRAKELLKEAMNELRSKGIPFGEIKVGTMIETPASALIIDALAEHVDFFSIGTNDLTQYVMAADRGNARVAELYNPLHPSVIRMIYRIIEEAHKARKEVGMCGEMASDPKAIPLLVGMGLDEFSMNPPSIPRVKKIIRSIRKANAEKLVEKVLKAKSISEVEECLSGFRA